MIEPTRTLVCSRAQPRPDARPLPRWLLVAGAVVLIGVGIDLVQGPPANALPVRAMQVSGLAALFPDHSVVALLVVEGPAPEAGASVAAYDRSAPDEVPPAPASTATTGADADAVEPGASVAAYHP